jgi:hypothetical protein
MDPRGSRGAPLGSVFDFMPLAVSFYWRNAPFRFLFHNKIVIENLLRWKTYRHRFSRCSFSDSSTNTLIGWPAPFLSQRTVTSLYIDIVSTTVMHDQPRHLHMSHFLLVKYSARPGFVGRLKVRLWLRKLGELTYTIINSAMMLAML